MLSVESQSVYDILAGIAGIYDGYKIVDADEITEKLPDGVSFTKIQLSQIIRELKDGEYIDIKYFTPDEYCLRVIKRVVEQAKPAEGASAEVVPAATETAPEEKKRLLYGERKNNGARPGLVLFMSFLGGILGSSLVAAVTAILLKFVI